MFISYRRSASSSAQLVASSLRNSGYDVFIDVESLRSGKFNDQLYEVIDNCKDFVLVLPENALDRCNDPEDWVRKEVCRAMKNGKNIIPVMLAGFSWPAVMPKGMETLKDYQAITATSTEYFDLAMQRLNRYLKSRSNKRRKRWLFILGSSIVGLLFLSIVGIKIAKYLSMPFYTNITNTLTQQTSIVSILCDTNEDIREDWDKFYSDYLSASGEKSRASVIQDYENQLVETDKDLSTYKELLSKYGISLSNSQTILLGLSGVDAADVCASQTYCESLVDDLENLLSLMGMMLEDGVVTVEESETVRENTLVFTHSANAFYYCYLAILSKMPDKSLNNYRKLVTEWNHFPNGVGLNHTQEEYEQYVEREFNALRDYNYRIRKRNMTIEQSLLDDADELNGIVSQYMDLYEETKSNMPIDSSKTVYENWQSIVILSSFLLDAIENEKDPDGSDLFLSTETVCNDMSEALKSFEIIYPDLSAVSQSSATYYNLVATGKQPVAGLVVLSSENGKVAKGDIVLKINNTNAVPDKYNKLSAIIQKNNIKYMTLYRKGDKVDIKLDPDNNNLSFLPLWLSTE